MLAGFPKRNGDFYRIALHVAGPDPRLALRELAARRRGVRRAARLGEWTYEFLQAIADNPGLRAPDLAASFGRETLPFKRDVRKLKELGLTISLEVGYQLSKARSADAERAAERLAEHVALTLGRPAGDRDVLLGAQAQLDRAVR